jgi:hypothetical protein
MVGRGSNAFSDLRSVAFSICWSGMDAKMKEFLGIDGEMFESMKISSIPLSEKTGHYPFCF